MGCLLTILFTAFCYALSWVITVGVIKLITLCFGWGFSLLIATGIWLIGCILEGIFKK